MADDQPKPGATSDAPIPVRTASRLVRQWIGQLGQVWVEGQISQLRPRQSTVWITLRDPDADLSIPLMASAAAVRAAGLAEGHRVVAQLKVNYFDRNGSLTWRASQFRAVGIGALMQQLEQLRLTLAQEGLFREEHKRSLPFLPIRIGLICGTNSAAQRDVEVNARRHWPTAQFEVREVTVQGSTAVADVITALVELDSHDQVDVIVITRGGGSFEDLLPFSNEALVRAVFAARTPVVSAIGHEEDSPLLDLVADVRASTPTAAGKLLVPDLFSEIAAISNAMGRIRTLTADRLERERLVISNLTQRPVMAGPGRIYADQRAVVADRRERIGRILSGRLTQERGRINDLTQRPALARPNDLLVPRRRDTEQLRHRLRRTMTVRLGSARQDLRGESARLAALSPQATLERGYAVIRDHDGHVITDRGSVTTDQPLDVRVAVGSFGVRVTTIPQEEK